MTQSEDNRKKKHTVTHTHTYVLKTNLFVFFQVYFLLSAEY